MDWNDKEERTRFLTAFRALAELHNRDVSKALTKLYHSTLAQHDIETVLASFRLAATNLRFFPKPVELLEFINGTPADLEVEAALQADEVLMAIRQKGIYTNVRFLNPTTNAVVRQGFGGWRELCSLKEDAIKWFLRDFTKRYIQFKQAGVESAKTMRGIGTSSHVELIGKPEHLALEGNPEGLKAFGSLASDLCSKKKLPAA